MVIQIRLGLKDLALTLAVQVLGHLIFELFHHINALAGQLEPDLRQRRGNG